MWDEVCRLNLMILSVILVLCVKYKNIQNVVKIWICIPQAVREWLKDRRDRCILLGNTSCWPPSHIGRTLISMTFNKIVTCVTRQFCYILLIIRLNIDQFNLIFSWNFSNYNNLGLILIFIIRIYINNYIF